MKFPIAEVLSVLSQLRSAALEPVSPVGRSDMMDDSFFFYSFAHRLCKFAAKYRFYLVLVSIIMLVYSASDCHSILFYSILFYSILFYSILFYSILYRILPSWLC